MFQGDEHDIHDAPKSLTKRLKGDDGPWRPVNTHRKPQTHLILTNETREGTHSRKESGSDRLEKHNTPRRGTYLSHIIQALSSKPEGMTIHGILEWLRSNGVYQVDEEEKFRDGVRVALRRQTESKNRQVWEYQDTTSSKALWKLDNVSTPERSVHASCTIHHSSKKGPSVEHSIQTNEETQPVDNTPATAAPPANAQHVSATLEQNHAGAMTSGLPRTEWGHGYFREDSRIESSAPDNNVRAETDTQGRIASPTLDPVKNVRTPSRIETRTHQQGKYAVASTSANVEPNPWQAEAIQEPTNNAISEEGKNERDYGAIVRELQRLRRERKTQEQKVKIELEAVPDIAVLQKNADEATAKEVELASLAEEAQQKAEDERRKLKDAMLQKSQAKALEEYLERICRRSHDLRRQLDIDD